MAEVRINLYEGMFLLNQQAVSTDFASAIEHIRDILNRAEAEILILSRWDERKLAYEIKNQKRGLFILAYFKARASQIANIDRDCNLSEQVLRSLIIRADYMGEAELELAKQNAELSLEARLRSGGEGAGRAQATQADKGASAVATADDEGESDDVEAQGDDASDSN
jgi:small subunit ribosomal protein S6